MCPKVQANPITKCPRCNVVSETSAPEMEYVLEVDLPRTPATVSIEQAIGITLKTCLDAWACRKCTQKARVQLKEFRRGGMRTVTTAGRGSHAANKRGERTACRRTKKGESGKKKQQGGKEGGVKRKSSACIDNGGRQNEQCSREDVCVQWKCCTLVVKQGWQMRNVRLEEEFVICGEKYTTTAALSMTDSHWKAMVKRQRGWYECSDADPPRQVPGKPTMQYVVVFGEKE